MESKNTKTNNSIDLKQIKQKWELEQNELKKKIDTTDHINDEAVIT